MDIDVSTPAAPNTSASGAYVKRPVEPLELAGEVVAKIRNGILLNSCSDGSFNSMVIGWGTVGVEWGRPIFIAYVREGRHTRELIDATGSFTVSVPRQKLDPQIFKVCGSMSGRNVDKVEKAGLTLVEPEANGVPGIAEAPITLECKVLYRRLQDGDLMPEDIRAACYPQDVPSSEPMANRDFHVAYYGQIVAAYVIEPAQE